MTELACVRGVAAEDASSLGRTVERAAWHGAWTVVVGTTPSALSYLARWHQLDMPWATLGVQLATLAPVCGALYGAGIALGLVLAQRCGVLRPLARVALPAVGAAIGGLAPGAFAAWHFGAVDAPYFGTLEILAAGVLAFSLFGLAVLQNDGASLPRAAAGLALALVPLGGLAATIALLAPSLASLLDGLVLESAWVVDDLALFGAAFGAIVGALFGTLLGLAATLAGLSRA